MNPIRDALSQYIQIRRALGTKYQEPSQTLGYFVDFLENEGAEFITTKLALRWALQPKNVQRATWSRRLTMVRKFAAWMSTIDPRTQVPSKHLFNVRHRRKKPYIFSEQQIQLLMTEADRLHCHKGLRPFTYKTFIGLLAATGLRPGEAIALDIDDVDFKNNMLLIRESKFDKSRFVPIAISTTYALSQYAKLRKRICSSPSSAKAFFISNRCTRLCAYTVRCTFAKLSQNVGLRASAPGKCIGRGPRLQDLRHTFATRKLIEWYQAGLNVEKELPKLSTYLGHVGVAQTYWYIEAVPELLHLATEYMAKHGQGGAQ